MYRSVMHANWIEVIREKRAERFQYPTLRTRWFATFARNV